jgi:hypothetical protein
MKANQARTRWRVESSEFVAARVSARGFGKMAMISLCSPSLMLLVIAAAVVLAAAPGHAQSALTTSFNHFLTGFPITGTHATVACGSCHVNGRFESTPRQCVACHNTMTAPGEPQSHPRTTNRCESCHLTTTWRDFQLIDHAQATGPCASCHNGKHVLGKSANHIPTAAPCGNCHHNTVSFGGATVPADMPVPNSAAPLVGAPPARPAVVAAAPETVPSAGAAAPAATAANPAPPSVSHTGIISRCATCHNNVAAPGKPPRHVVTMAPCETCHKSTLTFAGARMNHTGIIATCAGCRNGGSATGKPANHLVTNAPCETCHKSTVTFAGARVDHTRITAPCAGCHNGTKNEGKPPRHFLTALGCESCHRTATWTPASYRHASPAYVNHGPGVGCTGCHGSNAQTASWKFPAFRPDCASCHVDKYRPMSHLKFGRPVKVYYTIAELRDCTGACHLFADNTQRTIVTRRSGLHQAVGGGW